MDADYLKRFMLMYAEQLEVKRANALSENNDGLCNHLSGSLVAITHIMECLVELENIERIAKIESDEMEKIKELQSRLSV